MNNYDQLYVNCQIAVVRLGNDVSIEITHLPTGLSVRGKSDLSTHILKKNLLRRLQYLVVAKEQRDSNLLKRWKEQNDVKDT